jgi:hypothetical protein
MLIVVATSEKSSQWETMGERAACLLIELSLAGRASHHPCSFDVRFLFDELPAQAFGSALPFTVNWRNRLGATWFPSLERLGLSPDAPKPSPMLGYGYAEESSVFVAGLPLLYHHYFLTSFSFCALGARFQLPPLSASIPHQRRRRGIL